MFGYPSCVVSSVYPFFVLKIRVVEWYQETCKTGFHVHSCCITLYTCYVTKDLCNNQVVGQSCIIFSRYAIQN